MGPRAIWRWHGWRSTATGTGRRRALFEQGGRAGAWSCLTLALPLFFVSLSWSAERSDRAPRTAIALDPLLASSHSYLAFLLFSAGEYKEAEAAARQALELNPQKTYDHFTLGEILLARGHAQDSLAEMKQEPAPFWRLTGEALAYHKLGRSQDSNAALTQLIKDHQQYMAYQIAEIYADRRDADKAFQWLNRAYLQHDAGMRNLKIDPWLRGIRDDRRYAELLKKMNLPS